MSNHNTSTNSLEELQKKKLEKELEKIDAEIKVLKVSCYKNPNYIIQLLVPILGVFLAYFLYWATGAEKLLDIKKENLANEEKQLTKEIEHFRNDSIYLVQQIDTLKENRSALVSTNEHLTNENFALKNSKYELTNKNATLGVEKKNLENEKNGLKTELKHKSLVTFLGSMDTLGQKFNADHPLYRQIRRILELNDKNENLRIVLEYANDKNKLLNNRLTLLLAAYHTYHDDILLSKFISILIDNSETLYCNRSDEFQNVIPTLVSSDFNPSNWHLIFSSFLKTVATLNCNGQAFQILSSLKNQRKDENFMPNRDVNYYLNYVKIFRQFVLHTTLKNTDLFKVVNSEKLPTIILKIYWSDYIVQGKDTFKNDVAQKFQRLQYHFPDNYDFTGFKMKDLNYNTYLSYTFWVNWRKDNKEVINRFNELNMETYKTDRELLLIDLNK